MTRLVASAVVILSAMAGGAALWYGPPKPAAATSDPGARLPRRPQAAGVAREAAPTTRPAPPQDDLRVITERNIFLAAQGHGPASAPTTAPSPGTFVLKGIAQLGRQFVAFVEQPNGGGVVEVRIDHALGRGRVRGITLRTMDYEIDGKVDHVEVGQPVGGAAAPAAAVAAAPATRPAPARVAERANDSADRARLAANSRRAAR